MDYIGPQRFQPKSVPAIKAEVKQIESELNLHPLLNLTREELVKILGEPTDISVLSRKKKNKLIGIYKYHTIEYHFDQDGKVFLIYTDTDENGLHIEPRTIAER